MTFASLCTAALIMCAASLTSKSLMSLAPANEIITLRAPSMLASSSGDAIAASAATSERFSPRAFPMPMNAPPAPSITLLTSAKSRLIRPGVVMMSVIPPTPWSKTVSAALNASIIEIDLFESERSLSFGITISVSTSLRRASIPISACCMRRTPSSENGFVTTPTVRAPSFFATRATIGAAPVPVPPPSPAVMKTMSAPRKISSSTASSASAAKRPISGFAPAPSPLVTSRPRSCLTFASTSIRS